MNKKYRKFILFALLFSTFCALASGCAAQASAESTAGETQKNGAVTSGLPGTESDAVTEPVFVVPKNLNPLTGLESDRDFSGIRPVAVAINNTSIALPSAGVSAADLLIEVPAEGGETRILMFSLDYKNLGVVGSIRSARHYMLDFTEDFGAIFVHAGGSEPAYLALKERKINNIDGVNGYAYLDVDNYFYRDPARRTSMGHEHSLMITGEKIAAAIAKLKYETKLKADFKFPLRFVDYGTEFIPAGEDATNVIIPYLQNYRMQRLQYDSSTGTYLRFHNITAPYIDSNTDAPLRFTNVIILYMNTEAIPGDDKGRLDISSIGEGDGYYIYGGKSMPVKWKRAAQGAQLTLTDKNGTPLLINRGKTYIAIARTNMYATTELSSTKGIS